MGKVKLLNGMNVQDEIRKYELTADELREMYKHLVRLEQLLKIKVPFVQGEELIFKFNVIAKNKRNETYYKIDNMEISVVQSQLEEIIKLLIRATALHAQVFYDNFRSINDQGPLEIIDYKKYMDNYSLEHGFENPDYDDDGDDDDNDDYDNDDYDEPFPLRTEPVKTDLMEKYFPQKPDPSNDKLIERLNDIESEHDGGY